MQTTITHIEVTNAKGHYDFESGQLLKVTRETPRFYFVRAFSGSEYQVSKQTKRIIGAAGFIRTAKQPQTNF